MTFVRANCSFENSCLNLQRQFVKAQIAHKIKCIRYVHEFDCRAPMGLLVQKYLGLLLLRNFAMTWHKFWAEFCFLKINGNVTLHNFCTHRGGSPNRLTFAYPGLCIRKLKFVRLNANKSNRRLPCGHHYLNVVTNSNIGE